MRDPQRGQLQKNRQASVGMRSVACAPQLGQVSVLSSTAALLAIYAAGLGVPFLLVAMGIAMMTGYLSRFAFWILETFPALGRIG